MMYDQTQCWYDCNVCFDDDAVWDEGDSTGCKGTKIVVQCLTDVSIFSLHGIRRQNICLE